MHAFDLLARAAFALAGGALMLLALALIGVAGFQVAATHWPPDAETGRALLDGVGYTIIAIAIFLESLVTVFDAGKRDPAMMLYPTFLLLAGVALVVGLGVYQRLSAKVEIAAEELPHPEADAKTTGPRLGGKTEGG